MADKGSKRLLSQQIQDNLEILIMKELKPGDRLPTQQELCSQFNVGVATVTSALERLEKSGLVVRQHGRGTFVVDNTTPKIGIIQLPVSLRNENSAILKMLNQAVADGRIRYQTFFFDKSNQKKSITNLMKLDFQALICFGLTRPSIMKRIAKLGLRVISTDWIEPIKGVDMVGIDSFRAGEIAAETLIQKGHTRIGYIGYQLWDMKNNRFGVERDSELHRAGVISSLIQNGIEPEPRYFARLRHSALKTKRPNVFLCKDAFQQLFIDGEPPTGLVCFDESHVISHLREHLAGAGMTVPNDVSLVTFGFAESDSGISTVACRLEVLMEHCIKLIESHRFNINEKEYFRISVGVSLNHLNTVADIK
jgi:DNA-binding LacI/PurR family transcriptional regulator